MCVKATTRQLSSSLLEEPIAKQEYLQHLSHAAYRAVQTCSQESEVQWYGDLTDEFNFMASEIRERRNSQCAVWSPCFGFLLHSYDRIVTDVDTKPFKVFGLRSTRIVLNPQRIDITFLNNHVIRTIFLASGHGGRSTRLCLQSGPANAIISVWQEVTHILGQQLLLAPSYNHCGFNFENLTGFGFLPSRFFITAEGKLKELQYVLYIYSPCRICDLEAFGPAPGKCCAIPANSVCLSVIFWPGRVTQFLLLAYCSLYRRLLRAHRRLPIEMRSLGDDYVKAGMCSTVVMHHQLKPLFLKSLEGIERLPIQYTSWDS